ncbi:hypothetical protein V8U11_15960 [Pseudomonas chlororaphis]|uniref:hypothetical protein n=1 Tax=Pseudomonas chlororaphis TaxID=587753 RepID=UPI0030D3BBF9
MHYIPTPEKAVAYEALTFQEDHAEACGHYIAKTYGVDYVLAFPNVPRKLLDLVLSGFAEAQAQMQLYACFGFPLPVVAITEPAPTPKPKAKRKT